MEKRTAIINDLLRRNLFADGVCGEVVLTAGVAALSDDARFALLDEVRCFEDFDDVPGDAHDFGRIDFHGERYFFKIDQRTLTIMRADEN